MSNPTGAATGLSLFEDAAQLAADAPAIHYFDRSISYGETDRLSSRLAAYLHSRGFGAGERLALYLQNQPHFVIGLLAAWKLGGIAVPVNPMNLERELGLILADCRPKAIICSAMAKAGILRKLDPAIVPAIALSVSNREFQSRDDARIAEWAGSEPEPTCLFESFGDELQLPATRSVSPSDPALIVYTSGTTGLPKGAVISHAAFAHNAPAFRETAKLDPGDGVLGIAPLFHITGLVACLGLSFALHSPLVLSYRFEPSLMLDAIREHRPRFVIAAVTAFIAMANVPGVSREDFVPLEKLYSGGAPVPPAFVADFEARFGHYIHNCYGLTETSSATHIVPFGARAPLSVDGTTLSVGKPVPGATVYAADESDNPCAQDQAGELIIAGPMLFSGYWNKPLETERALLDGGLRTGDVAIVDDEGWCFLVDRKKDLIIASGYKVWPREVEDVLYAHPAVREAAVVGIADSYRGQAVKAFVSLRPGSSVSENELREHCSTRMAKYKRPGSIEILSDLPKTLSGKILRRELRS